MWFFGSYIGMYVVQSVIHSVITLFVVEMSLKIWHVEDVFERFRYRLLVIVLPFFMFHVFQLINPERGSFYFVEDSAIFASMRWLEVRLWEKVPVAFFFFLMVFATSTLAVAQEVMPIARDFFRKSGDYRSRTKDTEIDLIVGELSSGLDKEQPSAFVVESEIPLIYTTGAKNPSIVLSSALIKMFDRVQLRSAIAHELAHILRRSNITTLIVFVLRIFMFYNPVSLLVFRRLVQDDEHICDDITVSLTGDPHALATTLKAFYLNVPAGGLRRVSALKDAIESSSHNLLLKERITRLEENVDGRAGLSGWGRYMATLIAIVVISYFVV